MRMSPEDFEALRAAVDVPRGAGERARWDALWRAVDAGRVDVRALYGRGLNDEHIDTALRRLSGGSDPAQVVAEVLVFVRFSCDCVGMVGVQGLPSAGHRVVVKTCDSDGDGLGMVVRDMSGKGEEPLSDAEALDLLARMDALMGDGTRMREVRSLLR